MKYGIAIAEDGKTIADNEFKFQTFNDHLPIDLEADPPHMKLQTITGGTALTSLMLPSVNQETLLTVPHKLGFTPFCMVYFYILSYNGSTTDVRTDKYVGEIYPYSGSSGTFQDFLTYKVDNTNLRIIHYITHFFGSAMTSDANKYQVRVKYYISSIDTGLTSYTGDRLDYI